MYFKRPRLVFGIAVLILGSCVLGPAQESVQDLKKEIEILKQGQVTIQKELQEIKQLLQGRAAARPTGPKVNGVEINLGKNPAMGSDHTRLTLVEFTDYQ